MLNTPLLTTQGDSIEIIDPGFHNTDSGPDFFNARIKIEDTLWAGNVEIHVLSSDWIKHSHQKDEVYDNVVLHVVYSEDKSIKRKNKETIPTVELAGNFNPSLFNRYQQLMLNRNWVPCQHLINSVSRFTINNWLDRILIERLESKSMEIFKRLEYNKHDWNETFYQLLARTFGFKVNAIPFELLARSLPVKVIGKHKNNLLQVESLLFGQAGMLNVTYRSQYFLELKKEYDFLSEKYNLFPIDNHLWRFMRMRPTNFPTIRISQFAQLIHRSSVLFSKVLETESLNNLMGMMKANASAFWDDHYTFRKKSKRMVKKTGKTAEALIVINTVIPFLFSYGKARKKQELIDQSLKLLEQIPGESNSITRNWNSLGFSIQTAFNTQALIELKNSYCKRKQCLRCGLGNSILSRERG